MGNKVNKSKKKRGWRKNNPKRMHEAMKARHLQAENFENKENTPVASVNVPAVGISQQNIFGLFDDAMKERQLQTENIEDKENNVACWKQENGTFKINEQHDWFYQVQGQLHITRKDVCLFVVWTEKDMKIETIKRDDEFWKNNMETKLKLFYFDCLLPEIIDSRLDRKMEIREPQYILEAIHKKEFAKRKKAMPSATVISEAKRKKVTR